MEVRKLEQAEKERKSRSRKCHRGEAVQYQPSKSMVHWRQVALYSSKAKGKGSEMAALRKHPIDCLTLTLLSWEIKESKRLTNQCRPGIVLWVIKMTKILKWNVGPRSRQGSISQSSPDQTSVSTDISPASASYHAQGWAPVSRTLQPSTLYWFLYSISAQCPMSPFLP